MTESEMKRLLEENGYLIKTGEKQLIDSTSVSECAIELEYEDEETGENIFIRKTNFY